MKGRSFQSGHLKFLVIAIAIMVLADRFLFDSSRPYVEQARQEAAEQNPAEYFESRNTEVAEEKAEEQAEEQAPQQLELAKIRPEIKMPENNYAGREAYGPQDLPAWQKHAVPADVPPGMPKVIIVIDDLGVSRRYSKETIELPGPLTLAFLPYAGGVAGLVEQGRESGHEIIVHMPMEPMNGDLDTGNIVLRTDQSTQEFADMLDQGLGAFSGYVGVNNHMGSRLTQDKGAMRVLMNELKKRGLMFLDSRTIAASVAAETAAAYEVPYAVRDVFLDHDPSLEGVMASLARVESVAREHGQAIAIGHPKPNTIRALKAWLPTLEEKGLALVPISAVAVRKPALVLNGRDDGSGGPSQSPVRRLQ